MHAVVCDLTLKYCIFWPYSLVDAKRKPVLKIQTYFTCIEVSIGYITEMLHLVVLHKCCDIPAIFSEWGLVTVIKSQAFK